MSESLDALVDHLNVSSKRQILALLLSTSDGVPLARSSGSSSSEPISEDILQIMETVWATLPSGASHHLRLLGNEVKMATAFYDTGILIHVHYSPLVATFLATPNANIGEIRALLPSFLDSLDPLRKALVNLANGSRSVVSGDSSDAIAYLVND